VHAYVVRQPSSQDSLDFLSRGRGSKSHQSSAVEYNPGQAAQPRVLS